MITYEIRVKYTGDAQRARFLEPQFDMAVQRAEALAKLPATESVIINEVRVTKVWGSK